MPEATVRDAPTPIQPIRDRVRAAVRLAWDRAAATGALPSWPRGATRPSVEVERPADPAHGDFASNLAMKLARPYRMAPLAIATALARELDRETADDPDATSDRDRRGRAAGIPQHAAAR